MSENRERDRVLARTAWYMALEDVLIGHRPFGHHYPMSGDDRPDIRESAEQGENR